MAAVAVADVVDELVFRGHRGRGAVVGDQTLCRKPEEPVSDASYDLARLRVNGLIARVPGKNRYRLTGDGLRFAIFYTKVHDRLLRPLLAADQPPAPLPLRKALRTIDTHIAERIDAARLPLKVA